MGEDGVAQGAARPHYERGRTLQGHQSMAEPTGGMGLGHAVALLGMAVVAVPLFRRLGLGSVLGYLAAGLLIGPFGLKVVQEPEAVLHVAELGVVMFLFIIGLEMRPARLWALKKDIFGLGSVQVMCCWVLLSGAAVLAGLAWPLAGPWGRTHRTSPLSSRGARPLATRGRPGSMPGGVQGPPSETGGGV